MLITSSPNGTKITATFFQDKSLNNGLRNNKLINQSLKRKFEKTSSKWSPLPILTVTVKSTDGNFTNTVSKVMSLKVNQNIRMISNIKIIILKTIHFLYRYFSLNFTDLNELNTKKKTNITVFSFFKTFQVLMWIEPSLDQSDNIERCNFFYWEDLDSHSFQVLGYFLLQKDYVLLLNEKLNHKRFSICMVWTNRNQFGPFNIKLHL